MIRGSAPNPRSASTRRKIDQLYECVRYCENECSCRRTMQLQFFGEKFDRSKCSKTCDNCKAGREAEQRDMTSIGQSMLGLLNDVTNSRAQVTLNQLSDLLRGSKSKSVSKVLQVCRSSKFFGTAKTMSKHDLDRVGHAMIFEHFLQETSFENNSGFSTDYLEMGDNAFALQNGQTQFMVEFPRKQASKKAAKSKTSQRGKKTPKRKAKATTGKSAKTSKNTGRGAQRVDMSTGGMDEVDGGLHFSEGSDDDDDDDSVFTPTFTSSTKRDETPSLLPTEQTKRLADKIKNVTILWAKEEQEAGNEVYCKLILTRLWDKFLYSIRT